MSTSKKKSNKVHLACGHCQTRNYTTPKTQQRKMERLELKKFCPTCSMHTLHRETK